MDQGVERDDGERQRREDLRHDGRGTLCERDHDEAFLGLSRESAAALGRVLDDGNDEVGIERSEPEIIGTCKQPLASLRPEQGETASFERSGDRGGKNPSGVGGADEGRGPVFAGHSDRCFRGHGGFANEFEDGTRVCHCVQAGIRCFFQGF